MNNSGEATDQIVRLMLNGTEHTLKIVGKSTEKLALILLATINSQKQTKGKTRLSKMLISGKELKVFCLKSEQLKQFSQDAKRYGVLYTVVRDKNSQDGSIDVIVGADSATQVNRIFERMQFGKVDVASIANETEKKENPQSAKTGSPLSEPILENGDRTSKVDSNEKLKSVKAELAEISTAQKSDKQVARKARHEER